MEPTGEKKVNMSSRFSPRTLAFLGVAALLLVLGAVMGVQSQASVAATAVSAPSSLNAAAGHDYSGSLAAVERAYYLGRDTANVERSNVAAARYTAMGEAYGRAYAAMGQAYAAMRPATTAEAYGKAYAAMGEAYVAMGAATLERSNAAAQYAAIAEYYAHFMLANPDTGNGSVTSEIAPMGDYSAGRTAPSEKHLPGGGP